MTFPAPDPRYSWHRAWEAPMKRLHQDATRVYMGGMKRCWDEFGSPMAREHIAEFVNGYCYAHGPAMDDESIGRLMKIGAHVASFQERGEQWYDEELKPQVQEIARRLRQQPEPTRPLSELIDNLEERMAGHAELMGYLHWKLAASAIAREGGPPSYDWPQKYAEITGRPETEASVLIAATDNEMSKTVKELRKLARIIQSDGEDSERFQEGFQALLGSQGYRTGSGWGSSSNTFEASTWNVDPEIPLAMIRTYAKSDLDAVDAKEKEAAKERERLTAEVREQLKDDPEKLQAFDEGLAAATYHSYILEDHNDWIDQTAAGVLRDAEHIVGLRLVADGVIDDPSDVQHLHVEELRDLPEDVRTLVAERKREHDEQCKLEAPERIGDAPAPPPDPIFHDEGEGKVGDTLRGIAASPGRYTGVARVFLPSPIPPDVEDGEILVAKDAGPDWTPVFPILGAVVLDVGAAWQHAGVVAREFGIPAVTGTKVGTETIQDGQTITVDGTTGIVELATS